MMTAETRKLNAPANADVGAKAREIGERIRSRAARHQRMKNWAAGLVIAAAVGTGAKIVSGCGGTSAEPYVEPIPSPSGVCSDLQGRVVRIGSTELALNEAALTNGMEVKLGGEDYRMVASVVTVSGALCKIVDADGNNPVSIVDQEGNPISESFFATPGSSWRVTFADGSEMAVTLCGIVAGDDGKLYAIFQSDNFYWCTTVNRFLNESEAFSSGYGRQDITYRMQEAGQEEDRSGAECLPLVRNLLKEGTLLENPMPLGVQEYGKSVKVRGKVVEAVQLSESGYLVLATSEIAQEREVGQTITSESTGVSATVNEICRHGEEYAANITIKVNGVTVELRGGAEAGELVEVRYTDSGGVERSALVRVNEVGEDGKVLLEILVNPLELRDGGVFVDAEGNAWSVSLLRVEGSIINGIEGWTLTQM